MIQTNLISLYDFEKTKRFAIKINDFIKNINLMELSCGQYQLGDGEFVNVVNGKSTEYDGVMESHKNYIDVHYVISGREKLYCQDIKKLNSITEYNKKDDYILYKNFDVPEIDVCEGNMVVLFPEDGHRMLVKNGETQSKKLIFKFKTK